MESIHLKPDDDINDKLDKLDRSRYVTVYLQSGSYNQSIHVPNNVYLVGNGPSTIVREVVILGNAKVSNMMVFYVDVINSVDDFNNECTISNLTIGHARIEGMCRMINIEMHNTPEDIPTLVAESSYLYIDDVVINCRSKEAVKFSNSNVYIHNLRLFSNVEKDEFIAINIEDSIVRGSDILIMINDHITSIVKYIIRSNFSNVDINGIHVEVNGESDYYLVDGDGVVLNQAEVYGVYINYPITGKIDNSYVVEGLSSSVTKVNSNEYYISSKDHKIIVERNDSTLYLPNNVLSNMELVIRNISNGYINLIGSNIYVDYLITGKLNIPPNTTVNLQFLDNFWYVL
jgi:hypothetical protein